MTPTLRDVLAAFVETTLRDALAAFVETTAGPFQAMIDLAAATNAAAAAADAEVPGFLRHTEAPRGRGRGPGASSS